MDKERIKEFWDNRAKKYKTLPFESIANLEEDPENLQLKISLETKKVFDWLGDVKDLRILDLGAGVGQWSFRLVDRGAKSVTAVEYSADLVKIGRRESEVRKMPNLEFVVSPAEDFVALEKFDVVFISGLFVYVSDDQVGNLIKSISRACHSDSIVLLRDGTGVEQRFEINDKMSDHLQAKYSATYRTRKEYVEIFDEYGLKLIRDENMFDDDCPLNKYPETRLRVYLFRPR